MSTIMSRDGAEFWWGIKPPKNVISYHRNRSDEEWTVYTTDDVLNEKRENQKCELAAKRRVCKTVYAYIYVFHNDTWLMGGWYLYIHGIKLAHAVNFRKFDTKLALQCMELYPCGVLPMVENFNTWLEKFGKIYFVRKRKIRKEAFKMVKCELDPYNEIVNIFSINS